MNKTHESKLFMYDSIISYCETRMDVINSMPALKSSYNNFKSKVTEIRQTLQNAAQIITGFATDKAELREKLIEQATSLSSKAASYAKSIKDNAMHEAVSFSQWKLERLRDEELAPVCQNILGVVNNIITQLAAYNVTADDVADFDANIQRYIALVALPRNAVAMRRKYITQLETLFKEADDLLKGHLDRQVREYKITNPDFYIPYKNNRDLVNNPTTPTQFKGTVKNNNTDEIIEGVSITIVELNITVVSDKTGRYVMKPVPPETYTLIFKKKGFETKTISGMVARRGKIVKVDVALSVAA